MQPIRQWLLIATYLVHERMRSSAKPARAAGQATVTITLHDLSIGYACEPHILQHHHCNNNILHAYPNSLNTSLMLQVAPKLTDRGPSPKR
jgi:hypothetical protein